MIQSPNPAMHPDPNTAMNTSADFVATETSTPTPREAVDILLPARLWGNQALMVELLQECVDRGMVVWRVLLGVSASMPSWLCWAWQALERPAWCKRVKLRSMALAHVPGTA